MRMRMRMGFEKGERGVDVCRSAAKGCSQASAVEEHFDGPLDSLATRMD
jgi:hypothetical protein